MITYDVTVSREEPLWVAIVTGGDGKLGHAATDLERFAGRDLEVRDLISLLSDTGPDDFGLRWRYVFGEQDVTGLMERLEQGKAARKQAAGDWEATRDGALGVLLGTGLTQAAVAQVLGISRRRVRRLARQAA